MKTLLILPYFGKLPNYFALYLHTVKSNPSIQWLIVTDDTTDYDFPSNVNVVYKSFQEIQQLFQSKFDFKISLDRPHKLCDFKPAFGYVFEEYLKGYDYWGHCDPDVLWGNFNKLFDFNDFKRYDKIFLLGHLSLYKNNSVNNLRFRHKIDGEDHYQKVFANPLGYAFDEKYGKSINQIFKENDFPIFLKSMAADVDSYSTNMRLSVYKYELDIFVNEKLKRQIFTWEDGSVYRYFFKGKEIIKEEFLYIHLQKRPMKINLDLNQSSKILITPNEFLPLDGEVTVENFNKFYKKKWFNRQFFMVKWNSFKYKLKYLDYFYGFKKKI